MAKTLSREEVDALWEQLLREERYEAIQYLNRRLTTPTTQSPTRDNRIVVRQVWATDEHRQRIAARCETELERDSLFGPLAMPCLSLQQA